MEDLGQFLKQQREAKKIAVEELSIRTRIGVRFIRAIEENQFDQLPNQVSARGFLRSYARSLGLDESPILQRFSELVQAPEPSPAPETNDHAPSYIQVKQPDRLSFPSWAILLVGGAIFFLLILVLVIPNRKDGAPA